MLTESSAIVPPVSEPVSDASFYVSATEPTTRLRRTMKHDDCFLVFDSHGDIGASLGGPDGLFNCDTRYLSHFELLINGLQPLLLGSNLSDDNCVLSVDLTNPDIYYDRRVILQKDLLHVARTVFVWRSTLIEIKPPSFNKGSAVDELMKSPPFAQRTPLFVGDDVTDESVFAVMPALGGFGYSVGREVPGVEGTFGGPQDVRDWLTGLCGRSGTASG
jgi:N-terminal domain of (some) glycogen debranching enzymes/Trehalose-phosphatase